MTRVRSLFLISVLVALATGLVACGGGDNGGGGEDPQKVLDATFSGSHEVNSGDLNLSFDVNVEGDQSGSLNASITGPFQSEGKAKIPQLDLTAKVNAEGGGQSFDFEGGLTTTSDQAFVSYSGTDYEVDQQTYDTFKSLFENAAQQGQQQNQQSTKEFFKQLGISDPQSLLTNLNNDGDADVEGTNTIHISGDLDVDKTVEAFKTLLSNASALGALGADTSQLPSPDQLDQVKSAIKSAHFDVYSGKDDDILRRLTLELSLEPPSGSVSKVDISFDLTLGSVNEDQTIEAPANAKPLSDLLRQFGISPQSLQQLGQLGGLGSLGGTGLGGTGGGGTTTPSNPPSNQQTQAYLDCIGKASSAADLQACSALAP